MKKLNLIMILLYTIIFTINSRDKIIYRPAYYNLYICNISIPFIQGEIFDQAASRFGYKCITYNTKNYGGLPEKDHEEIQCIVLHHMPNDLERFTNVFPKNKIIVMTYEVDVVYPKNHNQKLHEMVGNKLTWNDSLLNQKGYYKYQFTNQIEPLTSIPFNEKKFCIITTSYLKGIFTANGELYTERIAAVDYFEKNAPEDLDVFGWRGWKEYGKDKEYKTFKGYLDSNKTITERAKYKFCICYENVRHPGLITEKLLHCLLAKTVPIYLGATNIEKYLPSNCFVNKDDFKSYDDLYKFLKNMSEDDYNKYIINIENFLNSDRFLIFSPLNFAENLLKATIPEYNRELAFDDNQINILAKIDKVKNQYNLY